MPKTEEIASRTGMIRFYKDQLKKFREIGIGNTTKYGVRVTETVIESTKRRLDMLIIKGFIDEA